MKRTSVTRFWIFCLLMLASFTTARQAQAHVGNKDVYEQITLGGYKLYVTIRTPVVIPGVATIEVRSLGAAVSGLRITPLMLTGEASQHPPTPDAMKQSKADPQFFTGSLWLMQSGSLQVRLLIDGAAGPQTTSIPVPAAPTVLLHMQRPLGLTLAVLGIILLLGMAGIVAAGVREARLRPGLAPDSNRRRRALIASAIALAVLCFAAYGGGKWWNVEAADYAANLYTASELHLALTGNTLGLQIGDPNKDAPGGWKPLDNKYLLLDHGHIMHLYAIRWPQMDAAFHLHPTATGDLGMRETLPAMPAGDYKLFGDIVYHSGFAETVTAQLTVPQGMSTTPLAAEDASALPAPLFAGELGATYKLPAGYSMVWDKPASLAAATPYTFRFTLLAPDGQPASDMQPYLGMAGHAAFVKTDGTTFAHTHPEGSAAMPAMMLAADSTSGNAGGSASMMSMSAPVTPTVEFPYGFPSAGRYRIFIQMKHGSTVETGAFDAEVE